MKLQDLLEMPLLKNQELKFDHPVRPFMSLETIDRDFDYINKDKTTEGDDYFVVMKKDNSVAIIGVPWIREPDKREGIKIYGDVEFKHVRHLTGMQILSAGKNVVQVDLVRVPEKLKSRGWGFYLYLSLAAAGYVIISDNTQFIGGKALWKKIAERTVHGNYAVYMIDDGKVRVDDQGNPIIYTGKNIDDSELWSENTDKKYTLFALRSKL